MKKYINGAGFVPKRAVFIKEISATYVEMYHERSGAELVYLDRSDENKTFAIGFKTIPTDDTGVFHILEHSVLSGSLKYPVKDPLSELMKSTLYTYVNALTYPDKTLYPVSGKNERAFCDLISVYMDAVFHPLALQSREIFLSEGRRFEPSSDGTVTPNGVVYNEMKGAYSSPDELAEHYLSKLLFKGGTYSHDSGGFPASILDLSFESFVSAHANFYDPSNCRIFLDGEMDLQRVLELIDRALPSKREISVPPLTLGELDARPAIEYYGAEDKDDGGRLILGYRGFPHSALERSLAVTVTLDAIADGNTSPLKRPIIESGLCENMYIYYSTGTAVGTLEVQFLGVKEAKEEELIALFDHTLRGILDEGIDGEKLSGSLYGIEFKTREADFGSYPKGMVYMGTVLECAFLGDDPVYAFEYDRHFSFLREKIGTAYYADALREIISGERATLRLLPKAGFTEELEASLLEKAQGYSMSIGKEGLARLASEYESFLLRQSTPDTDEAIASIPTLSLTDLKEPRSGVKTDASELSGVPVILHTVDSSGIAYIDYLFDISDLSTDEASLMKVYLRSLADLDTELGSSVDFNKRAKMTVGDMGGSLLPVKHGKEVRLYLKYSLSVLYDKLDEAMKLTFERFYMMKTDNKTALERRIKQMLKASKLGIPEDGSSFAITRTLARYDGYSALRDALFGYGFHSYLLRLEKLCGAELDAVVKSISDLVCRVFKKERLTLAIASEKPSELAPSVLAIVKTGGIRPSAMKIEPLPRVNEGIAAPSSVAYTAVGTNFLPEFSYDGSFSVASSILLYEHLWGEIRLSGGAYDTGFITRANSGGIAVYSYRDPSPMRSVGLFPSLGEKLRSALSEGIDLTKYIISSVGQNDTVSTPRSASSAATLLYLSGKSEEDNRRIVREIIATDENRLIAFADMLDRLSDSATYTVVASREELLRSGITNILEI